MLGRQQIVLPATHPATPVADTSRQTRGSYATNHVGNNMTAPPPPPPGWYPDPGGANTQRYFDGTKWTDLRESE
jgi:hypothetical protein